jgi:protein involved in polysaccharide export with SLBB domain
MILIRAMACVLVLLVTGGVAHAQPPATGVESQQPAIEFDPVAVDTEYRIRPGDVLTIKFFYNPELNETVPVRPDGRISLELIDEVRAAGRTVSEFKTELANLYSATLKQPVVAVIVKDIAPRRVYVGGEVGTPGLMEVTGRLTLVQALFQAGGLRRSAQTGNVVILRYQGTEQPKFMKVDINKALSEGDPHSDVMLQPLDIVWVPKTKIARVNDFIDQYFRQVVPIPLSLGVTYILGGLVQ